MKRYLLILTALMVLVGILGLPPRSYTASWWFRVQHRSAERQLHLDLRDEIQFESWLYQRGQWRVSVSKALQSQKPSTDPYLVALPAGTPDSIEARVEQGVSLHLQAIGALPPKLPVGVFLIPRNSGRHPSSLRDASGYMWTREFYVAREGEEPFCALVEPVDGAGYWRVARAVKNLVFGPQGQYSNANTLRICGFFARYGKPGGQVESWLRGGAAYFGSGTNMAQESLILLQRGPPRGPFGLMTGYSSISHTGLACLAGVDSACLKVFIKGAKRKSAFSFERWHPEESLMGSPVDFFGSRFRFGSDFGVMEPYIFTSLVKEFGVERFELFWASELPVLEAFQSAFGVSADEWVMSWARDLYGGVDRGPAVPAKAALLSFLTFGIFVGGALFMGRRKA